MVSLVTGEPVDWAKIAESSLELYLEACRNYYQIPEDDRSTSDYENYEDTILAVVPDFVEYLHRHLHGTPPPGVDDYGVTRWHGGDAVIESETNPWLQDSDGNAVDLIKLKQDHPQVVYIRDTNPCDQCGDILPGVIEAMDSPEGIQRCDQCDLYEGDLDAAQALADYLDLAELRLPLPLWTFTVWFHGTNIID